MAPPADTELRRVAELFLDRRLRQLEGGLDASQKEAEAGAARQGLPGESLVRELLVSAWVGTLQTHCRRVQTDLVGLLRSFDALSSGAWAWRPLDTHVDQAAAEVMRRLTHSGPGRVSSLSSDRNRMSNLVPRIKAESKQGLMSAVERAQHEGTSDDDSEPAPALLDDRLPLRRRGMFDQDLVDLVERAKRSGEPVSLVMLDIDHFKRVNDEHGHPVGDEVLVEVAAGAIKSLGRKGKGYRYGGEEFALLLPDYSPEEAVGLAERIRKEIVAATFSSKKLKLSASFGVACLPDHAADWKLLLEKADAALYQAKEQGRNRVCASGS